MLSSFDPLKGLTIFDDKGEVKRLVQKVIQEVDPEVAIDRMRKLDFSYVFVLSKKGKSKEIELGRSEIVASQEWRRNNIDETLRKKITDTISDF